MNLPTLADLACLNALLEARSVSGAARAMGMSQPAMSHALMRLRQRFGDPLLVRTGRSMAPTARAEDLARRLAGLLDEVRDLTAPPGFDPGTSDQVLRLAAADYPQAVLVPPLIRRLAVQAPRMRVAVVPIGLGENVLDGSSADVVITLRSLAVPQFRTVSLWSDHYAVLSRPGRWDAAALTADAYAAARHVMVSPRGQGLTGPIDAQLERLGKDRAISAFVTSFWTAAEVVSGTDLVTTVPAGFAALCRGRFEVEAHPLPFATDPIGFSLFWREKDHAAPAHAWFRRQVSEVARLFAGQA